MGSIWGCEESRGRRGKSRERRGKSRERRAESGEHTRPRTIRTLIMLYNKLPMLILLLQCAAFWMMAGVTWTLQILNYPLLEKINSTTFASYQQAHNKRFGKVMIPGVLLSVLTTAVLFFKRPDTVSLTVPIVQAVLLLLITASAAVYAAPAHKKLEEHFDEVPVKLLILTNWMRLAGWMALAIGDLLLLAG